MSMISRQRLEIEIDKAMLAWLAPLGFKLTSNHGCARWHEGRYTYLGCQVIRVGGENQVQPFGQTGWLRHQRVFTHFMLDYPVEEIEIAVDLQIDYAHLAKNWTHYMHCEEQSELGKFLEGYKEVVVGKMLAMLESFENPSDVLAMYVRASQPNTPSIELGSIQNYDTALTALILARLYSPEHYPMLKKRLMHFIDPLMPSIKQRASKLIAYLDQRDIVPI